VGGGKESDVVGGIAPVTRRSSWKKLVERMRVLPMVCSRKNENSAGGKSHDAGAVMWFTLRGVLPFSASRGKKEDGGEGRNPQAELQDSPQNARDSLTKPENEMSRSSESKSRTLTVRQKRSFS